MPEKTTLHVLSLFSGIQVGGLELGLERAGMRVVGQVEIDPFCQRVLAKHWPEVPRHDDVRTAIEWWRSEPRPRVDLVCGGFPCQDISIAGKRIGIGGERSGLWSAMASAVRVLRPRYVLVENVTALLARGFDAVLADLAESGYDTDWDCISAAAVGAAHRRDRVFIVAHAQREQLRLEPVPVPGSVRPSIAGHDGAAGDVADGHAGQLHRSDAWAAEPDVGRVAHGVPARVDRLRALGNAVVPQVAEHVGRLIVAAEHPAVTTV